MRNTASTSSSLSSKFSQLAACIDKEMQTFTDNGYALAFQVLLLQKAVCANSGRNAQLLENTTICSIVACTRDIKIAIDGNPASANVLKSFRLSLECYSVQGVTRD